MKRNLWMVCFVAIAFAAAPARGQNLAVPNAVGSVPMAGRVVHIKRLTLEQMHLQQQAIGIKAELCQAGYTDPKLVQPVVDFITTRTAARAPISQQSADFANLVSFKDTSDADVSTKLQALRRAVTSEADRTHAAIAALDAQINYSKDPRLEAILNTLGIFDNLVAFAGMGGPVRFDGGLAGGFGGGSGDSGGSGSPPGVPGGPGAQRGNGHSDVFVAPQTSLTFMGRDDGFYAGPGNTINGQPGPGVGVTFDLGEGITATGHPDGSLTLTLLGGNHVTIKGATAPEPAGPPAGREPGSIVLTPVQIK